eukprot:TRINITY_DN2145_c0_g1_i5.p1 TRINITY_DN2145_c0_g1~~TRINITY_DN2145_c0_g1_i5.p1  ORF type:complete len:1929 (-),score=247.31 TRINITY_DN2145_c0_g1_i5:229-5232(-)
MSLFKILKTIQSNMENPEASEHVNVKNLKHAGKLYLPEKLYGREEELLTLFDEMNSVIQGKQKKNITLVSGISGIGKTGIVMELIHAIPPQQITFLMAKSDQLMSSVPYHILREAFTRWVTLICSREEENIHYWREKILHETFPDTRILFDIIPELEGIVGHVPEVAALPTVFETAKRFQSVWVSFLKALTSEKLLLLFIDDLQWTDPTSLELLQIILCHPELQNIMFVGAYRSNEKSHFFTKFVEMISVKQEIVQIELSSLTMSQTSNMLVDTFSASQEKIEELTKWVYTKTGGIPFGIKLFLKSLHEADLVRWDGDSWDWDIEKIASCNMNGSVVDLVIERIKLLSPECQKALSLASVVGHTFNLEVLAFLLNKDLVVTCSVLWYAVHANLICPSTSKCLYLQPIVEDATCQEQEYEDLKEFLSFSFAHDRIQTAAYQLLSENETWAAHIKLASYIERSTTDVIERVMHLNLACKALNREETKELIILNMRAATEAKSKMAYNQALDFVFAGEKCLEAFHSDEFSEVRFEFKTLKISLYFILLRLDDALDTIDKALEKRNELTDTQILELIHQKLNAYLKKGDFCTGLCLVNQVLGDTLTEVTKEDFCALADKILSMDKLDIGTKEVPYADLLFQGWVLSFLTGRVDWKIKYAFAMNVFLAEGGFSIHSAHFLTCLACTMANNYGDIEKSQMIYQLVKKYEPLVLPMPRLISRSMAVTHAFYYMPFSTLIDEFQDVLRESIHTGSYNWGAYAIKNAICFAWIGSYPLSYISQVTEYGLQYITKKVDPSFHRLILFYKHMADLVTRGNVDLTQPDILNTYLKTEHPSIITDFKAAKQAGDRNSWFSSLWGRLLIGVIFINRPNGIAFCQKLVRKLKHIHPPDLAAGAYLHVLIAITNVKALREAITKKQYTSSLKRTALYQIEEAIERYKYMAKFNPSEWTRKLYFLQSLELEAKYFTGYDVSIERVVNMYKKTLDVTGTTLPYLEIGMTSEILHEFLKDVEDHPGFSQKFRSDIHHTPEEAYYLWGSKLKVQHLQCGVVLKEKSLWSLKIQDLLFSLTALPRTCQKEELLHSMMRVLLEDTGYNKGVCLIENEVNYTNISTGKNGLDTYQCHHHIISDITWTEIPKSLISFVQTTKEPVVLTQANKVRFLEDIYFKNHRPLCVVCMPFGRDTNNVVYLESHSTQKLPVLDSMEIVIYQMRLIIEAWCAKKELHKQIRETEEAHSYKKQQAMFIDALCHEMRNPLNGLFGSLEVLKIFTNERNFYECFTNPFFLGILVCVATFGSLSSRTTVFASVVLLYAFLFFRLKYKGTDHTESLESILRDIKECMLHQESILDDTLQVQRLDSPEVKLELAPTSILDLIRSVVAMFLITIKKKGLKFSYKHKGPSTEVLADPLKLKQVVINLVSNAVKFTEIGTIKIRTKTQVETDESITVTLQVKDTGVGFSDRKRKMFAYFEQLDRSYTYGGSGLGLAISKKMVDLMHGSISAQSVIGEGSTFTVKIPVTFSTEKSAKTENKMTHETRNEIPNLGLKLGNILVVDDNTLNRKTLSIYLAKQNLPCSEAEDGELAVNICRRESIDSIIMDVKMPNMDGITATKMIRDIERERGEKPAVIIGLSGNQSYAKEAFEAGMDDFLTKPIAPHTIIHKLQICSQKKASSDIMNQAH